MAQRGIGKGTFEKVLKYWKIVAIDSSWKGLQIAAWNSLKIFFLHNFIFKFCLICRNNYSVENRGAYSEHGEICNMEHFAKRINGAQGSTTLLKNWKRNSDTGVFLWVLRNFKEHLFYCTPPLAPSERGSNFNNAKVLKLYENFMSP